MFDASFIRNLINRRPVDDDAADTRLVALVNEARSGDEQLAIGRFASDRLRFVRRHS